MELDAADAMGADAGQVHIERMALNDTAEGRAVAAAFVDAFGQFMSDQVRPVLRRMADDGQEPQLLVNGLAELLRLTADSIEAPIDAPRPFKKHR